MKKPGKVPVVTKTEEEKWVRKAEQSSSVEEREQLLEYIKMFRRLRRLITKSYNECLDSSGGRGYYALCTLISQQREVINDLRMMTDLSAQASLIQEQVFHPLSSRIAQDFIDYVFHVRRVISELAPNDKAARRALQSFEAISQDVSGQLRTTITESEGKVLNLLLGREEPKKRKGAK